MTTIYAQPTSITAADAGDNDTANDHDYCALNDQLITAKAEADGHDLVLLPEADWAQDQTADNITDWATWEQIYGDEYGDTGFWLA